jgi:hypothetical protein
VLTLLVAAAIGQAFDGDAPTKDVVDVVARNCREFAEIPSLGVRFELEYEHITGQRKFAFDRAEVKLFRKGDKVRLSLIATLKNGQKLIREVVWDGKIATSLQPRTKDKGDYAIGRKISNWAFYYNYYFEFMSYPGGLTSMPGIAKLEKGKKLAPLLPIALTANLPDVVPSRSKDIDGVDCVVLATPRDLKFWFDPERNYALKQSEQYDPETKSLLNRTTFREFRQVGSIWLPSSVLREEYGGSDDPNAKPGELRARKAIKVTDVSTLPLADSDFRIAAPNGVMVHNNISTAYFTHYSTGANPVIGAARLARDAAGNRNAISIPLAVASSLAAAIVLLGILAVLAPSRAGRPEK